MVKKFFNQAENPCFVDFGGVFCVFEEFVFDFGPPKHLHRSGSSSPIV